MLLPTWWKENHWGLAKFWPSHESVVAVAEAAQVPTEALSTEQDTQRYFIFSLFFIKWQASHLSSGNKIPVYKISASYLCWNVYEEHHSIHFQSKTFPDEAQGMRYRKEAYPKIGSLTLGEKGDSELGMITEQCFLYVFIVLPCPISNYPQQLSFEKKIFFWTLNGW